VSYATASEIAVAHRMGATMTVQAGVVIPWKEGGQRPFEPFIKHCQLQRQFWKDAEDLLAANVWKTIGNSAYGKTGQAVHHKSVFDTREGRHKAMKRSSITQPAMAAFISGIIRALVSELMAGLPSAASVVSVTTDGIITDHASSLPVDGPVALLFREAALRLRGDDGILDDKGVHQRLLSLRTRMIMTLETLGRPKVARGGIHTRGATDEDANRELVEMCLNRVGGERFPLRIFRSLFEMHTKGGDLTSTEIERHANFEPDFKRQLVGVYPVMVPVAGGVAEHIAATSAPWPDIDSFEAYRDAFDDYRKREGGILRTMDGWRKWQNYLASRTARGNRRGGTKAQAARIFAQAYVERRWGMPGDDYAALVAWAASKGIPINDNTLKNASRSSRKAPITLTTTPDEGAAKVVLDAFCERYPDMRWRRLFECPAA
jgi:hypothetical protein